MTFKHTKFEDSTTMRSLEKLAREKGWVKSEPITKQASSELDLTPTSNLTENIIKLCEGLKKAGFDKYAIELEDKLIAYKKAASLYEVSDEKGEDLVDAAHPKGSHKLEGVEGDEATVETILDQHSKLLDIVNKKPLGKLASSKDVINAVKTVLADGSLDQLYAQLNDVFQKFRLVYSEMAKKAKEDSNFNDQYMRALQLIINNKKVYSQGTDFAQRLSTLVDEAKDEFSPGIMGGGAEYQVFQDEILPLSEDADELAGQWSILVNKIHTLEAEATTQRIKQKFHAPSLPEEPDPEKIKFQARAKTAYDNLAKNKTLLDNKTKFNDAERTRFVPKIDDYTKQVQQLSAIATHTENLAELSTKLEVIEAWIAKLDKWINSAG